VRFEVTVDGFTLSPASLDEAQAHWDSLAREPLVPDSDVSFVGLPAFEEVGFADAIRVGVKAANLAELRQLLGAAAPPGFAVPFSAFHAHMTENRVSHEGCAAADAECQSQNAESCAAARARCESAAANAASLYAYLDQLLADPDFASNTAERAASLRGFQHLVRNAAIEPRFAASLDARVGEIFGAAQVRLRSSTNVEDLSQFTGAGLYESVSAYATGNRRASSQIRTVWASVWAFEAFEERALWNVEQRAVRMGVAVNPARDDEQTNGVLITQDIDMPGSVGMYVNVQAGEISVTNPPSGALPEMFSILERPGGGVQALRQRFSSLSPDVPLLSDAEIQSLYDAAQRVQTHFAPLYAKSPTELALDLEFKFVAPDRALLIKQARPYFSRDVL
jgi:hypothetical protein